MEGSQTISLKVGSSFVLLEPGGVTIVGPVVKVNSGGTGIGTGDHDIEDPLDAAAADTGKPCNRLYVAHGGGGPAHRRRRTLHSQHAAELPVPPPPPCSAAEIKVGIAACDGGTHLYRDATTALGKEPDVQVTPATPGFAADTDTSTGVIRITPTTDCCQARASLFFELTNARSKPRHEAIAADAAAGNVSRDDYAKRIARVEYDGVILLRDTFNTCRGAWGCSATATSGYESVSNDFETYYAGQTEAYKDHYRNGWDSNFKAAYDAKHP
jgi:hypothetical protein